MIRLRICRLLSEASAKIWGTYLRKALVDGMRVNGFDWALLDVGTRFPPTKRGEPVPRPTKYSSNKEDE